MESQRGGRCGHGRHTEIRTQMLPELCTCIAQVYRCMAPALLREELSCFALLQFQNQGCVANTGEEVTDQDFVFSTEDRI